MRGSFECVSGARAGATQHRRPRRPARRRRRRSAARASGSARTCRPASLARSLAITPRRRAEGPSSETAGFLGGTPRGSGHSSKRLDGGPKARRTTRSCTRSYRGAVWPDFGVARCYTMTKLGGAPHGADRTPWYRWDGQITGWIEKTAPRPRSVQQHAAERGIGALGLHDYFGVQAWGPSSSSWPLCMSIATSLGQRAKFSGKMCRCALASCPAHYNLSSPPSACQRTMRNRLMQLAFLPTAGAAAQIHEKKDILTLMDCKTTLLNGFR